MVALLVGGLAWSAAGGTPTPARHPQLFSGSIVLDDARPLTVVDLADAAVTVRLKGVYAQVGAKSYGDIQAVPVDEGTMLVNRTNGTFNLLGNDDYLVDPTGGGIGLGPLAGATGAQGFSDGADAYIVRYAPHSTVSLVDRATVTEGAKSIQGRTHTATVTPRGYAALGGRVADRSGSVTVSAGNLWSLVGTGRACRVVESIPVASAHNGLVDRVRARLPVPCTSASLASAGRLVGVAMAGQAELFDAAPGPAAGTTATSQGSAAPGSTGQGGTVATGNETTSTRGGAGTGPAPAGKIQISKVKVGGTSGITTLLPVTGTSTELWYLARSSAGWSAFGVGASGHVDGPRSLGRLGRTDDLAPPVESNGRLYTLDRSGPGLPELWTIDPATGAVAAVAGEAHYPEKSATENPSFAAAEVLAKGPRVIFNSPDSELAVVVFTDGSHPPVKVDKSTATDVSPVGPGDIDAKPGATKKKPVPSKQRAADQQAAQAAPTAQPVNQQVTCQNTTQTPHVPVITSATPSTESVDVTWSYQLLDEQDCEPDSWAVHVTALGGVPQPDQPIQEVDGQDELLFTGLRPAVQYQVVVTAYINHKSTTSKPATFTTQARGPDAPVKVTTTADGHGNWIVRWSPCTASDCYVPAHTWTVEGTSCSTVFIGSPPKVVVDGNEDEVTIPAGAAISASASFSVWGSTAKGLIGPPTTDHECTEAWQAPNPSEISLGATAVAAGSTVTATLQVSAGAPPAQAFGSSATEFTYSVGGVRVGPTSQTTVSVPNLPAGVTYTPSVSVAPAAHPTSAVTVTGPAFSKTVPWPAGLALHAVATVEQNPNLGSVAVSFPGLPAGTFTVDGALVCGSVETDLSGPLTGGQISLDNLNLDVMGGACKVSASLTDTSTPNPFGVASPTLSAALTIGSQPVYGFAATVDPTCVTFCSQAATVADVTYSGPGQPPAGVNWTITPAGSCANVPAVSSSTPAFPYQINLSTCADPQGAAFVVSWEYLGATVQSSLEALQGTFGTTTTTTTPPPTTAPPTTPPPTTPPPTTAPPTTAPPTTPPTTAAPTTQSTTTTTTCPTTTSTTTATTTSSTSDDTSTSDSTSSTSTTPTTTGCLTVAAVRGAAGGASRPSVLAASLGNPIAPPGDRAGTWVIEVAASLGVLALGSGLARRRRGQRRRPARGRGGHTLGVNAGGSGPGK